MQTVKFDEGVEVQLPDAFELFTTQETITPSSRGSNKEHPGLVPEPAGSTGDPVVKALRKAGMTLVRTVAIIPKPGLPDAAKRGVTTGIAGLKVDLAGDEEAVVLTEQEGMYLWKYPVEKKQVRSIRKQRDGKKEVGKQLTFQIDITPSAGAEATTRTIFGGMDLGFGSLKAYILRFLGRGAVKLALDLLEKDLAPQLIHIKDLKPANWKVIAGMDNLALPAGRPPRVLLLVHGTFSSTVGAFSALGDLPWGQELLRACFENYDAVTGFDHRTLREDPLLNAQQLLDKLAVYKGKPVVIDIITHSRGALVVRSLVEKLLPASGNKLLRVGKVVFVGSTNEGTLLAEPANWERLIDLYTNLIAGTARVVGIIAPQARPATTIVSEVIKNLGSFVKYCAIAAITDRLVPGLAAMEPDGEFVKDINLLQQGQPAIADTSYCVITSDFIPSLTGEQQPREFPKRFLALLAGGFVKQLMKEPNDLVVNIRSMGAIDTKTGNYIKEKYDFGINPQVYHTNYFTRPEVTRVLARWLQLKPAQPPAAARGLKNKSAFSIPFLPATPHNSYVPAAADQDILLFDADDPVEMLSLRVAQYVPSYVVLKREHEGQTLYYAFKGEEILQMTGTQKSEAAGQAFNLHDTNSSGEENTSGTTIRKRNAHTSTPSGYRRVVTHEGKPVGVIEETKLPDAVELAAIAITIKQPAGIAGKILRRRTMPSFATPANEQK